MVTSMLIDYGTSALYIRHGFVLCRLIKPVYRLESRLQCFTV